jgi:hypothetical protein
MDDIKSGARLFKHFLFSLIKETVLLVLLALDIIGALVTYLSPIKSQSWINGILIAIPILAVLVASFNIYRRSSADIRLSLFMKKENKFQMHASGMPIDDFSEWQFMGFRYFMDADFTNYGPQIGKVLSIEPKISCNNISDPIILECMNFKFHAIKMLEGKKIDWINGPDKFHYDQRLDNKDSYVDLPITLEPGKSKAFTLYIELFIDPMSYKTAAWLKTIQLTIEYEVQQSDGIHMSKYVCLIPAESVKTEADEAIDEELRNRKEQFTH